MRLAKKDAKKVAAAATMSPAEAVKTYLGALPPEPRKAATELRALIRETAPGAVEHFSYGIPGFRFGNQPLIWYAGWRAHVSIYPFSDVFAEAHGIGLDGYETSKGTIRFPLSAPLPLALIKKLVKARLKDLGRKPAAPSTKAKTTKVRARSAKRPRR